MKSPYTGKEMSLKSEVRTDTYRGKDYQYTYRYYECEDTHEQFTTTALDEVNFAQIYNQYRVENGIPFPDEIKLLRSQYGLSALKMAQILGFGDNQYRLYENVEVPNVSNGRMINSIIQSPQVMLSYVDSARHILGEDYAKIRRKVEDRLAHVGNNDGLTKWVFTNTSRDRYNGYAHQSISLLKNVMLYFIENMGPVYKTQMNKLLFYTDFAHYRDYGQSLTGLRYIAIQFGPVPQNWDRVYCAFDEIQPELVDYGDGVVGELLTSTMQCDAAAFTEEQKAILDKVLLRFKDLSSSQISKISHEESAWKDNINVKNYIDYVYSFDLKNI